jgi:hypothetical protein
MAQRIIPKQRLVPQGNEHQSQESNGKGAEVTGDRDKADFYEGKRQKVTLQPGTLPHLHP